MIKCVKDLEVYRLSFSLAMEVFRLSRAFPKDELYSLVSQLVRASRSIPSNISEGWAKRKFENVFKRHLLDSLGSVEETKTWLDFSLDCKYLSEEIHMRLIQQYEEVGAKIYNLHDNWKSF